MLWEGEILCLIPKSEHPLLKESGRLREYDRVYAKCSLVRIFWQPGIFQKNFVKRKGEKRT